MGEPIASARPIATMADLLQPPLAHISAGPFEPTLLAVSSVALVAYAQRARTLSKRGSPVAAWRQISFFGGVALILVASFSPVGELADELVAMHMVEHLLMAEFGALAIVVGLTGPLLAPILRIRVFDRLRILTNPLIAFPLWAIDLYAWHLPVFYEAALRYPVVHALEHMMLIGLGINMWMPLLGPLPQPAWFTNIGKLVYIIAVRLAGGLLANVFLWSGSSFYPYYEKGQHFWNVTALSDQGLAGTILLIEGSLLTLGLFAWLFLKAARESEERQQLVELADRRGIALSAERARRAVAAGRGAALRERLESQTLADG